MGVPSRRRVARGVGVTNGIVIPYCSEGISHRYAFLSWPNISCEEIIKRCTGETVKPWMVDREFALQLWNDEKCMGTLESACAICGRIARLYEDHDHTTLLTRGWLCNSCNTLEGNGRFPAWECGLNPAGVLRVKKAYNGRHLSSSGDRVDASLRTTLEIAVSNFEKRVVA